MRSKQHQFLPSTAPQSRSSNATATLSPPKNQHNIDFGASTALQFSATQQPIQMLTKIKYSPTQKFKFGTKEDDVGRKVEAHLDPNDPIKGSDTKEAAQTDLMHELPTSTTWKKGHLLNHDLGGRAIHWNLFPITTSANSEHYHEVEKPIKHWIGKGKEVRYEVSAIADDLNDTTDANGRFVCTADVLDTSAHPAGAFAGKKIRKTIFSSASKKSFDRHYKNKTDTNISRNGQVRYDGGTSASVARDEYGSILTDSNWEHHPGTKKLNVLEYEHDKQLTHTSKRLSATVPQQVKKGDKEVLSGEHTEEAIHESVTDNTLSLLTLYSEAKNLHQAAEHAYTVASLRRIAIALAPPEKRNLEKSNFLSEVVDYLDAGIQALTKFQEVQTLCDEVMKTGTFNGTCLSAYLKVNEWTRALDDMKQQLFAFL